MWNLSTQMHIDLNLEKHCIETEIKRRYVLCISRYFKRQEDLPRIEAELKLLESAMKTLDFGALRSRYVDLAGQTEASITLARDDRALLVILIDGRPVDL